MRGRRFRNVREWTKALDVEDRSKLLGPSPGGAADKLGFSREHIYRLIRSHKLDAVKIGRGGGRRNVVYITEESIERFNQERERLVKESS